MPRIRKFKNLIYYKKDAAVSFDHIDKLFTETINWKMMETYLPDMLKIAMSIRAGKITPSSFLKKLSSSSRKNKLYFAFRELGRAIRTGFLLEYITDTNLRKTIQAVTNISEEFNGLTKWVSFGGDGVIGENIRYEQLKMIKYNHLITDAIILHNVNEMTGSPRLVSLKN